MELALQFVGDLLQYMYLILVQIIKWGSMMTMVSMIVNVWDKRN